jgi:hypothetical protein
MEEEGRGKGNLSVRDGEEN